MKNKPLYTLLECDKETGDDETNDINKWYFSMTNIVRQMKGGVSPRGGQV